MAEEKKLTGYPSIDKPWLKYYSSASLSIPLPDCSIVDYLYECNQHRLEDTALIFFSRKISFKELFDHIDRVAISLKEAGVKKGDIVSVCTLTAPETVYLFYAINKIGAVSNMIALTSPVSDLREQIHSTHSKLVFSVDVAYETIVEATKETDIDQIVVIPLAASMPFPFSIAYNAKQKCFKPDRKSQSWKQFLEKGEHSGTGFQAVAGSDLALIMYTGGTTGVPKGVMLSNTSINAYSWQLVNNRKSVYCFEKGDTFLSIIPPFLAYGIMAGWNASLCCGVTTVLYPNPDPKDFPKLIRKYKPNHFCCGPLHISALIEDKKCKDLSFLKSPITGGEQIGEEWKEKVSQVFRKRRSKSRLMNGYGMTETCGGIATGTCISDEMIPLPCITMKVINEQGSELSYNEVGEICVSSRTLMEGYYNDEKATNDAIFYGHGMRWIHTGDLGYITESGNLKITGRIKRLYWKKMEDNSIVRVYPMRIEEVLDSSELVKRSTVVGKSDKTVGYLSIAYILLNDSAEDKYAIIKSLSDLCARNLPHSHIPDMYQFIESFPLTKSGKVDYRMLEELSGSIEYKGK